MKTILILDGHPDPDDGHLCHALASAYRDGAQRAGHRLNLVRIADLDFPLLRKPSDFTDKPSPETVRPVRDALLEADHLVLIYPLWLGTLPAYTKGSSGTASPLRHRVRTLRRRPVAEGQDARKIGTDHPHCRHAGPRLQILVWRAQFEKPEAEHPRLRRDSNRSGQRFSAWLNTPHRHRSAAG